MTLKEIEKVIDEATLCLVRDGDEKDAISLGHPGSKLILKRGIEDDIKHGCTYIFYKFDERTIEVVFLAKVDHIDKEKKVIKKRIDDMSAEELYNLTKNFCAKHPKKECTGCPLWSQEKHCIGLYFNKYKRGYLEAKDKEFEIEVEGK